MPRLSLPSSVPARDQARLNFLWSSACAAIESGPRGVGLAVELTAELRRAARVLGVPLPAPFSETCPCCSAIQVAGVSCRVRVVQRGSRRKRQRVQLTHSEVGGSAKNEVRFTCMLCCETRAVSGAAKRRSNRSTATKSTATRANDGGFGGTKLESANDGFISLGGGSGGGGGGRDRKRAARGRASPNDGGALGPKKKRPKANGGRRDPPALAAPGLSSVRSLLGSLK